MAKTNNQQHRLLSITVGMVSILAVVGIILYLIGVINTGVKGNVIILEGNCMPPVSGQCASESQNTRTMKVALYKSVIKSEDGTQTPSEKVAEMMNVTNTYSLNARPGKYYLFYRYNDSEDSQEYCAPVIQTTTDAKEPCEVTIPNSGKADVNITFNLVTY